MSDTPLTPEPVETPARETEPSTNPPTAESAITSSATTAEGAPAGVGQPSAVEEGGDDFRWAWWAVAALTLVGGFLRFWKLDHASLWGDEINFVLHSAQPTFKQYLDEYMAHFAPPNFPPHLPVATVIEFVVLRFGVNDFLGRFSAALLGTLTVPMAFVAARALFDRATGVIAAALVMLSFFLIYYAREANYYAPLVFFAVTFLAVFWTFLMRAARGERVPWWGLALVWLSGTILLQTHLAAVLWVAAIGMAAVVVCVLTVRALPVEERGSALRTRFLPLALAYLLCWVLVMPWIVWTMGLEPSLVDIPPHRQPTLENILKLPARYGWGNFTSIMAPAAALFWACAVAGLIAGLAKAQSRRSVATLVFVALFVVAVFSRNVRTNGLSPHYLILTVIPLLFITALGVRRIGQWLAARTNREAFTVAFPAAAVLWLTAFEVRPLQLLYQLPGKPTDWRGIAQWMSANLPAGTTVYFDWYVNVWQHVPTYYKTPGITCASTMPVAGADHMIQMRYRDFTKYTLMKYSDAAYLEAMRLFDTDPRFDSMGLGGTKWDWPPRYFRRSKSFRNEAILELDRLGICPIALNYTNYGEVEPILYYNTPEDLLAIYRELLQKNPAQAPLFYRRLSEGFRHAQINFAHVMRNGAGFSTRLVGERSSREIRRTATVELYNLTGNEATAKIQLVGAAFVSLPPDQFNAIAWTAMPAFGGGVRYVPQLPDTTVRIRIFLDEEEVGVARLPVGLLVASASGDEFRLAVEESVITNLRPTEAVGVKLKPNEKVAVKLVVESTPPNLPIRVVLDDVLVTSPKPD
jgi:4-amino-4-deoxy-L-arabinose transferase-like glycosyltransferase